MAGLRGLALAVALALAQGLFAVTPASAMEVHSGAEFTLGAGEEVNDDLYVAADRITIDGRIRGALVAVANTITINGPVEGDVIVAGQTISLNGQVRDSVRAAGISISLEPNAQIEHDFLSFGYSLETKPGSVVKRDLFFAGAQATVAGDVGRNVNGIAARVTLLGKVGGQVRIDVWGALGGLLGLRSALTTSASPKGGGRIAPPRTGTVLASLVYPAVGADRQAIVSSRPLPSDQPAGGSDVGATLANLLRRFFVLYPVGLIVVWLFPRWSEELAGQVRSHPWRSLGLGVLAGPAFLVGLLLFIAGVAGLIVGFSILTLGDLSWLTLGLGILGGSILTIGFGVFASYGAPIVVSLMGGELILGRVRLPGVLARILPLAVGLVLFVALTSLPYVGGVINALVTLFGLGALWLWAWSAAQRPSRAPGTQPAPVEMVSPAV
jgi:hypothetical protein